ncbi:EamA family transporter [Kitasatospora nipponensis]|uniref:EamA family transporter n=1 Tax=Kitasatospora nipponensis TaxID=258049 RepID=A0ABN1WQW8_9ACTN
MGANSAPSTRIWRGVAPLVGFAALSAAADVYLGAELQAHSPFGFAALAFSLTAAFFLALTVLRAGPRAVLRPLLANGADVLAINVSTAVGWLTMLEALRLLEPAVVNVAVLAAGPPAMVLLGPLMRRGTRASAGEVRASVGILGCLLVLFWGALAGRGGLGHAPAGQVLAGIALTLVSGVFSTVNVLCSKRLSEAGHGPQVVLSVRFFLLIAVALAVARTESAPDPGALLLPATPFAALGVALPLYLIQAGVRHTEPVTASLLCTLSPLFTFVLQLPDHRLTPSPLTLACICVITALVGVGLLRRPRPTGPPTVPAPAVPAPVPGHDDRQATSQGDPL